MPRKPDCEKRSTAWRKSIASKENQLGNATFRSKAPEKIIRGMEATMAEQRLELEKLHARLRDISRLT